jgi:hypothetical protein
MSKFTDRLWRELMREHRAELERIDRPAASRRRRALPRRLLAGTSIGLAGAGTAIALAIGAASTTPAFAVTKNPDGTVSVTINKLTGVAGANQRLAQMNVRAVAVPVVAGCEGAPPPAAMRALLYRVHAAAVQGGTVKIDPKQIPAGKSLVLAAGPGRVNIAQLRRGKSWTAPSCFRGVEGAVVCSAGGPPPGFQTNTTDTTGTDTAPAPPTNTSTTTTTTTTGTTTTTTSTGPALTARRFMGCSPPPCAAGFAGPAPRPPTATATTGTTTAPPTATATTGTTTAPPTNTGTTGTTGLGRIQVPAPPGARFLRCLAPPRCAVGAIAPAAARPASVGKLRAALANARAAFAKDQAALAKDHAALARRHATRSGKR